MHALLYSDLSLDSGLSTLRRRHAAPAVADRRLPGPQSAEPAQPCVTHPGLSRRRPDLRLELPAPVASRSPAIAGVSVGGLRFAILVDGMLARSPRPGLRRIAVRLVTRTQGRRRGRRSRILFGSVFVFILVLFHMLIFILLYNTYGADDTHILTNQ